MAIGIGKTGLRHVCGDCGVLEGEYHEPGCDMERCPFCGRQLVSCDCAYKKLGIDVSPGTRAYKHGLTVKQDREWGQVLKEKGRIPYVQPHNVCPQCGKLDPEMFRVADSDWVKYVPPPLQKEVICRTCYNDLKKLFPNGWRNPVKHTIAKRSRKPSHSVNRRSKISASVVGIQ
jgi:hypothetical protein